MGRDLVAAVQAAGVVGAGGAGFPTHVKLDSHPEILLVNGAECEPLLQVDQELARAYATELVEALEACLAATGAVEGIFAFKAKYQTAREAIEKAIGGRPGLSVRDLGNYYPAGDEHIVVYEATGRVVPEGGIPLEVGAVVVNVETLYNVWQALDEVPVTRTYVTVAGAVARPVTLCAPIGTSVAELIKVAGGANTPRPAVIHGGPLMGTVLASMDTVVTKTSKGLIVLPQEHPLIGRMLAPAQQALEQAVTACCQCRQCTDLCPRYLLGHSLEPHRIMRVVGYALTQEVDAWTSAFLCSDCGVCDSFACPAGLSPRRVYRSIRSQLAASGLRNPHKTKPVPRPERDYRQVPAERLIWRLGLEGYKQNAPLEPAAIEPSMVRIPLRQHIGAAAIPLVQVGDHVARGQLVAACPPGTLGTCHHASIDGTVIGVSDEVVIRRES